MCDEYMLEQNSLVRKLNERIIAFNTNLKLKKNIKN